MLQLPPDNQTDPTTLIANSDSDINTQEQTETTLTSVKALLIKAGPLMLSSSVGVVGEFVKVYLLSKRSAAELASTAIIFPTVQTLVNPIVSLIAQNPVFIAEKYGVIKEYKRLNPDAIESTEIIQAHKDIGTTMRQCWALVLVSSVPSFIMLCSMKPFLQAIGQSPEIAQLSQSYFIPFAFAVPTEVIMEANERFLSAVDKEIYLLPIKGLTIALDIGLSFLFIPSMGVAGAGYASLIKSFLGAALFLTFLGIKKDFKKFELYNLNFDRDTISNYFNRTSYFFKMIKQGWPLAIYQGFLSGSDFVVANVIGRLGQNNLAIYQAISEYLSFTYYFFRGIAESTNRHIAQKFGIKNFSLMKRYGDIGLTASAIGLSTTYLVYNMFSTELTSLFAEENESLEQYENLIRYNFVVLSLFKIFTLIQEVTSMNLSAIEDTLYAPLVNVLITLSITLPLTVICTSVFDAGLYGVSFSLGAGSAVAMGFMTSYWHKQSKKAVKNDSFEPMVDSSNAKFSNLLYKFPLFRQSNRPRQTTSDTSPLIDVDMVVLDDTLTQSQSSPKPPLLK